MRNTLKHKIQLTTITLFPLCILFIIILFTFKNIKNNFLQVGKSAFQSEIKSHSFLPIASNQWYSSIYKDFPSQPLYAFPLVYKVSPLGLSFSFPKIVKTPQTIYASYNEDFTVGTENSFKKPEITSIGDWDIHLSMSSNTNDHLKFFLAQGMPYTIIHAKTNSLNVVFPQTPQLITDMTRFSDTILVKIHNNIYLFMFPKPLKATISNSNKKLSFGDAEKLLVALINNPKDLSIFKKQIDNDLIATSVTPIVKNDKILISYNLQTTNGKPLIGLLPHQYENLKDNIPFISSYLTLRGNIRLINASTFVTATKSTIPPIDFYPLRENNNELIMQINKDIADYIKKGPPMSTNYFLGTWLGKGATLLQLAGTFKQDKSKEKLFNFIFPIFRKSLSEFSYDKESTSLIANRPEFGNEKNNDHHFHYGYFIRAGAIFAKQNPSVLKEIKKPIEQMVIDIANIDKKSEKYPYLRNFDIYESHSWADGYAGFADGNNQESSSEAVNAWYAIYFWSKITNNEVLEKTSLYLYNSEILGTKYYWFGENKVYTQPYEHKIASIVWGGKVDFATWFSNETNMKYGIEILPLTPGSNYLGSFSDFVKYEKDFLSSGGSIEKSWGDLFLIWKSFYKPKESYREMVKVTNFEDNNSKSLFMYMILSNLERR